MENKDNLEIKTADFKSSASIGDVSWLIYRWRLESNSAMNEKWQNLSQYDVKTSAGFDGRVFLNQETKQLVVVCEGTQADKRGGNTWLSEDGTADAKIGLGMTPTQTKEGYAWFKNLMSELTSKYGPQYGIVLGGHSLGGANAQMISGMYSIDTGKKVPTVCEAGPGMLNQIKDYAYDQMMAGNKVYLPNGQVVQLETGLTHYFSRRSQASALSGAIQGDDFSNIINLITTADPVGNIGFNQDPTKDHHVGASVEVPWFLTARETMQDSDYESSKDKMANNSATPGWLGDFGNIQYRRFDRHVPEQSDALWSGTTPGLLKDDAKDCYDFSAPLRTWSGSQLAVPSRTLTAGSGDDNISGSDAAEMIFAQSGNDRIFAGAGGDLVSGGFGNDSLSGGAGDDYLAGGDGNDLLEGDEGNDILFGAAGADTLSGGANDDLLFGGDGNDKLYWTSSNDILVGGAGDDAFILGSESGATGDVTLKWERNFSNFGNDSVKLQNIKDSSHILFSFADEIKLSDMNFERNGNNLLVKDSKAADSVSFLDAFASFEALNGKIDFKFTNGKLYKDDQLFNVRTGHGSVTAVNDNRYSGSFLFGSDGDDIFSSGQGSDLLFGGRGHDIFSFEEKFGSDRIIAADSDDAVNFSAAFDASAFKLSQSGQDLVIAYASSDRQSSGSLSLNNWFASDTHLNNFHFAGDTSYKVENNTFVKLI